MRSQEEVSKAVAEGGKFIKSDLYKAGLLELLPYVTIEEVPEVLRKRIPEEVQKDWNPQEERENFESVIITDEAEYLKTLISNGEVNAAIFRAPRLLALVWLYGRDITKYDDTVCKVIHKHLTYEEAVKAMKKLIKRIMSDCGLKA